MNKKIDLIDKLIADWNLECPELNVDAMHVVGRIIKLGKQFEKRAGERLKQVGIHYTDLDVLASLRRSGSPYQLSPKQLMTSVLLTSGAMTALLNRLTKLELIYRIPDKTDGRIILAALTDKGKLLIDEAIKLRFDEAKNSIKFLSQNEFENLSFLLRKVMVYIDN